MNFDDCKKLFDGDRIQDLSEHPEGLLWLKIRAISRRQLIDPYVSASYPNLVGRNLNEQSRALFAGMAVNVKESLADIDRYIRSITDIRTPDELERIASELHKVQHFSWGGDYSNALDRFLVDRYIKAYDSYHMIEKMLELEIPRAVNGYVICSWYNHWSSILIENLFRQHPRVLPATGNIKKVDFFIDDMPFDLKTTYLPANYVKQKRKQAKLQDELAELKKVARTYGIPFDRSAKPKDVAYEITERIKQSNNAQCQDVLMQQRLFRQRLIEDCVRDPQDLLQNLYEEQGAMRFDASNRLFLILADTTEFDNSWKLKRNPDILKRHINSYLDDFSAQRIKENKITFQHKSKAGIFTAYADAIFVVVPSN